MLKMGNLSSPLADPENSLAFTLNFSDFNLLLIIIKALSSKAILIAITTLNLVFGPAFR